MIAYLALVGIGFVVAALIAPSQAPSQAPSPAERERTDALRRLNHPRF